MTEPLIVSIPHRLGKEEAVRRLKVGIQEVSEQLKQMVSIDEEIWSGDRLTFRVTALRQQIAGTIDVMDTSVRLELVLPWLLARIASGLRDTITRRGSILLEKK